MKEKHITLISGMPGMNFSKQEYLANKDIKVSDCFVLDFEKLKQKILQESKIYFYELETTPSKGDIAKYHNKPHPRLGKIIQLEDENKLEFAFEYILETKEKIKKLEKKSIKEASSQELPILIIGDFFKKTDRENIIFKFFDFSKQKKEIPDFIKKSNINIIDFNNIEAFETMQKQNKILSKYKKNAEKEDSFFPHKKFSKWMISGYDDQLFNSLFANILMYLFEIFEKYENEFYLTYMGANDFIKKTREYEVPTKMESDYFQYTSVSVVPEKSSKIYIEIEKRFHQLTEREKLNLEIFLNKIPNDSNVSYAKKWIETNKHIDSSLS